MNIYEQTTYKGYNINIYYDEYAESPRTAFENLGTLYTAHRRYRPEKDFDSHFDINKVFEGCIGNFRESFLKRYIALPVYLYDHSGQTVATTPFSCPWDSGFFGIIAVSLEKIRKEYGWKNITSRRRSQIESYLQCEIQEYDHFLRNEVYGFTITAIEDGIEEVDSCWGYYGDDSLKGMKEECQRTIDNLIAA